MPKICAMRLHGGQFENLGAGRMTELLTAAQMRAIEQAAIASGEVTGLELMERAGRGVVESIFEEWPELRATSHRAVVLCGPGNNGGDGFVVARLLKEWGWEVEVFLYGDPERLPPDARVNYERWLGMGEVRPLSDEALDGYSEDHPRTRIAVDALFGTGLVRPFLDLGRVQMELNSWQAASRWDKAFPQVVAVDLPSGLCADSGRFPGSDWENPFDHAPMANLTVTFHRMKNGHVLAEGPAACGRVVVKEIGLTSSRFDPAAGIPAWLIADSKRLSRGKDFGHKYSHGHALILSGPSGRGGAARLAARGALRIGAGVVTVGCPPEAVAENAARLDAVMLRVVGDGAALDEALADKRISALCLGPGLGTNDRAAGLVAVALGAGENGGEPRPAVLDADALTILARDPGLFARLHPSCVLTPHAGEFARLFPDIAEKLAAPATNGPAYSKVDIQ